MPRFIKIRNNLAPLLHPLQTPAPAHPLANQPTPNEHLQAMKSLPPNIRLEDRPKGPLPDEVYRLLPYASKSGVSNFGHRRELRMLLHGDNRLTEQQQIIKDERKHWDKEDLKQLSRRGGWKWALRER